MCYVVNMCYGVYNIALWRILRVMTASCAMSSYKVYMCYQRYVVICRLHVLWRLPHCTMTSTHVLWRLHMYYDVYTCVMTSTHVLWPYLCYIIFCNGVL
jgi:hypothetical protein